VTSSETARTGPGQPTPEAYSRMDADPRFVELRRRFRNFVFPMTVVFLSWYLLYVLLSAFGRGFMDTKVVGNLNVAFFFGLLQFVSTFLIAWAYARFADRRIDPTAAELRRELQGTELEGSELGGAR
jgi:uncharacterized membrane protein (DUF485 family)